MNKTAIKKYAIWARQDLINRVSKKALMFGISSEEPADPNANAIGEHVFSDTEKKQRTALIAKIKAQGYNETIEEVAYTWFNRFAALRFMEVNGYIPTHIRVFTNDDGEFKPQILTEAIHLDLPGLDMDKVYALKEADKSNELFRYLIIAQCNALNEILPGLFQRIDDYTELLLPDNLLREGSVIHRIITDIPEEDFLDKTSSEDEDKDEDKGIAIIGWLYQYYIFEKHEEVVDPLHGKVVKKEEIPAATQLFTTNWVVQYLIDNSVGRYWIERNPNSTLAEKLTYFIKPKNGVIKTVNEKVIPQEVTVFDPCVGSGHFLIYAFEVLMKIYKEYGYSKRDAVVEIVQNNLFGLDVDCRAVQLAYFAVMMRARRYDRRFFSRKIQPHIYEITESNDADKISIEHFCKGDSTLKSNIETILSTFSDAKEYGSILKIPAVDFEKINNRFTQFVEDISLYNTYLLGDFQNMIRVAEVMSKKYAVVATNPPYLNKYDTKLKSFIGKYYKNYKGDLFSVFIYLNFGFCLDEGYSCFMSPMVWMFIQTYEKLRKYIIDNKSITTLIQFEYSAYEEATVPICTFVLQNSHIDKKGCYLRLVDYRGGMEVQRQKALEAISTHDKKMYFEADAKNFAKIPGAPVAYWVSEGMIECFGAKTVKDYGFAGIGMRTGDNDRFLRFWYEISTSNFSIILKDPINSKWFPYNKGGIYRKWYGNNEYVVNWENDGEEIKENTRRVYPQLGDNLGWKISNEKYYFQSGITWTGVTTAKFNCRVYPTGFIFDSGANGLFAYDKKNELYLAGFLNTKLANDMLRIINPTINTGSGTVNSVPIVMNENHHENIKNNVKQNIALSKADWDSRETSWDFAGHPLLPISTETATLLSACYQKWKQECNDRFNTLKQNEEELNRIFIDIYGLQDELTPEVADKDVTVARIYDTKEEIPESMKGNNYVQTKADVIKSFISYAVGCMMGRYSLDTQGLAYAGGEWDGSKYKTFQPDSDAILPICDDEYFNDDIVGRFVEFVKVVYGADTLEKNLQFIADALGGRGTPREVIRNYFLTGFYADHVKTYQKRPIYWLFDSGKKNGFKCLVYMHRYRPDTIARIRTDYVHEQQSRYRTMISDLENRRDNAATNAERVKMGKKLAAVEAQAKELREYEEKIHHLADQMIAIDLDDGVKHNYAIFKDVLAKIK